MKTSLLYILTAAFVSIQETAKAAIIKPSLPAKIQQMQADRYYKIPGLDKPVRLQDPIVPGGHFSWKEATRDGSRMPENVWYRGELIPAAQITENIITLAKALEEIREMFGNRPIDISSWFRPPSVNAATPDASELSFHLTGLAADISIRGVSPRTVQAKLKPTWEGGLGSNSQYTHVDLRHLMGFDSARWNYGGQ